MISSYEQIVERIIKEQEKVIGPLAVDQARKVTGININTINQSVSLSGDKKGIVEELVKQYEYLFGKISIEVCKEALRNLTVTKDELPAILQ